jgi:purine-binding chemotaxis protein CheW
MDPNSQTQESQLVVFELAGDSYGVPIGYVQEIDRLPEITTIPEAPPYLAGVIDLRGKIVPVVNLRTRFGLQPAEAIVQTRVVVLKTAHDWVGVVVDTVSGVIRVPASAIQPPPIGTAAKSVLLQGIARFEDHLILLLDLDRILDRQFAPPELTAA